MHHERLIADDRATMPLARALKVEAQEWWCEGAAEPKVTRKLLLHLARKRHFFVPTGRDVEESFDGVREPRDDGAQVDHHLIVPPSV